MIPEDAERVLDLFAEARACAPEQRATFLTQACAGNEAVRAEIESLLSGQTPSAAFLAQPAFERGMEVLGDTELDGELEAGDTLGDYRVISLLGVGGMGEVYLADDLALGRRVALKLIQRGQSGTLLSHFRHERRVLAGLTHPNIARLYGGAVTPEGRAYLVMEYVEGERLDRYCDEHRLGISERLALFRKVCAAVAYAHQNLVVHRDLKPANIRVTAEGEPKLLDFGIAKLLDTETASSLAEVTATMSGAMTPEYASPEQLRGETITTASDVYSLGVVLYELLCGQRPYRLKSRRPDELARAICEQEPPPPSTVAERGPTTSPTGLTTPSTTQPKTARGETPARLRRLLEGDLDNIVAMSLRKEPIRRYTSVAQFSEDLRRHGEGMPVSARKDTLGYRAGKFVRRNKTGVVAAALVALALVGGLAAATWQARVARQALNRALLAQKQSEHLNTFLQDLLGSVDPAKMGKDVKVVEVLDASSRSVDRELAAEPELLAQAHETLSRAYLRLGVIVASEEHARAALALFRRLHGDDDLVTARAKIYLVDALVKRNRYEEMEILSGQALAVLRRQPAPDSYDLARALLLWGSSLTYTLHPHEAESAITEGLARMRQARGELDPDYLYGLRTLSIFQWLNGDYAGMEATCRRLIALADQSSAGSTETLTTGANLCMALFVQGKLAGMDAALQRLEPECRQKVGENNRFYGATEMMAGLLDFVRGDYERTILQERQSLDVLTALWSGNDYHIVMCRALLGLALTRTGQAAAGEPLLRAALADSKNVDRFGQLISPRFFDRTFGNLPTALGECLLAQKRYAEAEPLLLSGYGELQARRDLRDPVKEAARRLLHDLYTACNKPDEAARFASGGTRRDSNRP